MHRAIHHSSLTTAIAISLLAACGGNSASGNSANEECGQQTVYALTSGKDYVVLTSTANNGGVDGCGLMPDRLVGTSVTIAGGPPGLDATITLSQANPSAPPGLGGVFQGNIACNHGTLTAVSGYSDKQCAYSLFQTATATVTGTDQVELQMFAQMSTHQGCSPAGDACMSLYVMQLGRRQMP